jgi:hypothetical protein
LPADREIADQGRGIEIETNALEQFPRAERDFALVDEPAFHRFATKEEIRPDAEIGGKIELLMDQGDAEGKSFLDRADLHGSPVEPDRAGVRQLHAGEDFHQGAFARAVFPEHGDDLARADRKTHVVQCAHAGE